MTRYPERKSCAMVVISILIVCLAGIMVCMSVWYFLDTERVLDLLGRNIYLFSGIMAAGVGVFGYATIRILFFRLESWYALLEAAIISALISSIVIFRNGNSFWVGPGWGAIGVAIFSYYLRFLKNRKAK